MERFSRSAISWRVKRRSIDAGRTACLTRRAPLLNLARPSLTCPRLSTHLYSPSLTHDPYSALLIAISSLYAKYRFLVYNYIELLQELPRALYRGVLNSDHGSSGPPGTRAGTADAVRTPGHPHQALRASLLHRINSGAARTAQTAFKNAVCERNL